MVRIDRLGRLTRTLRQLAKKYPDAKVVVSYTAQYAVYVHEDMEANHPNGGQAKYLEQPAREMRGELKGQITTDIQNGVPIDKALFKAGLMLQRASQQLVPIDTGLLRSSAQTEIVK